MASMYPVCPNGHAAESPTSRFCGTCGSPIPAPAPQMPPGPPPTASTCPNGHPLARPNQAFCEICAAPVGMPAPTLGAAPGAGYPTEAVPSPAFAPPPVTPAAYEPPTIRGGGGSRNILALAIGAVAVFAAAALVAFLVMSPRGGAGPTPAPTPVAAAPTSTPGPTAPVATPTPTPATPAPTPTPAATPSPTPEPSATPVPPAGSTCQSATYGVTVTYPATWYAYAGDVERACTLFDPKPFTVSGANAQVLGTVTIFSAPDSMDKTVADYASAGKVLQQRTTTIAGRNATMLEIDEAGVGVAPDGMREYLYVIEYGTQSLIVGTDGIADPSYATADWPYEGYQDNLLTVDFIAQSLTFA